MHASTQQDEVPADGDLRAEVEALRTRVDALRGELLEAICGREAISDTEWALAHGTGFREGLAMARSARRVSLPRRASHLRLVGAGRP